MAGEQFIEKVKGCDTPEQAFAAAVSAAEFENGTGGYTGTIAEKKSFVMFDYNPGPMEDSEYAWWLVGEKDEIKPYDSPAGCFKTDRGFFYFFGVARS